MKTLRERFEDFDAANPHVWDLWLRFSAEAMRAGHRILSASFIAERIRWETTIVTRSEDPFKLNNNHRAYYARKFMDAFPELPGFRTRRVGA